MKTLKLLSIFVFALCLIGSASAIGVYGDWEDTSQAISIVEGESVNFNGDFISISPPMTLNIILYDAQSNIVHTFESNLVVSDTSYFPTYTIDQSVYSTPGYYELILSGSDESSVPAQAYDDYSLSLSVTAISDTNIPVITLLGDNPVTVVQDTTYNDAGATALDIEDGDITASIVVTGSVDTSTLGTYVLTYNVQDAAGNFAAPVTRTVSVVEATVVDTIAPVITLLGNNPESVALGATYTDEGATALDNIDGDITANIVIVNPVDVNTIGVYTITYNVQDAAGNDAIEVTRTVDVFDPNNTTPPTITVITPEDKEYDDSELTFEVEVDEVAEVKFSLNGGSEITMDYQGISGGILKFVYDVDLDDGDHEITFYATDTAGNTASVIVEFSIDTSTTSDKNNGKTTTNYYQSNYEEQLYLDQFKPSKIIYLEDDQPGDKDLNFWQRFIEWLKNLFGFN